MKKAKKALSLVIVLAMVLSLVVAVSPSTLAAGSMNATGVTKAVKTSFLGYAGPWASLQIKFDNRIDAGAIEASSLTQITNFVKLNGKTFSEILVAYPGSIQIYLGCSADKSLMELYIDTNLPAGYGFTGSDNFEVMSGLNTPSGLVTIEDQNFIRLDLFNFAEPVVNNVEFSQSTTHFGMDINYNVDINYGPAEISSNTSFTDYIKINGKTLTEIKALNSQFSYPFEMYVSCWPGTDTNNKKLNIVIRKDVIEGTGFIGNNDVVEFLPGLSMATGKVSKYQKFLFNVGDNKFYESMSVYKISSHILTPNSYYFRLKFTLPISATNVGQGILASQFADKIKFNGYTLTQMNTNAIDTDGNPLINPIEGYIWQDGTGDGFSDGSEVVIHLYINRNIGGGKGLKMDGTDVMEIGSDIWAYSGQYKTAQTEKFMYDVNNGIWNKYATVSFDAFRVSASKNITNVVAEKRTADTFKTGITIDNGATVTFKKGETTLAGDDALGTGTSVIVSAYGVTNTYTIIIYGDVDGNGNIDINDLAAIKRHLLKSGTLSGNSFTAGDLYNQNKITISSLIAVKKSILGISSINQNQ